RTISFFDKETEIQKCSGWKAIQHGPGKSETPFIGSCCCHPGGIRGVGPACIQRAVAGISPKPDKSFGGACHPGSRYIKRKGHLVLCRKIGRNKNGVLCPRHHSQYSKKAKK